MLDISTTLLRNTKGRMGVVRLIRGDVDILVVVAYMLPESCVSDRERNRRLRLYLDYITSNAPGRSIPLLLLDANGHTGLRMVQPRQGALFQVLQSDPAFHSEKTSTLDNFVSCWKSIS